MDSLLNNKENTVFKILIIIFAIFTILQCDSVYDSSFFGELVINGMWQLILFVIFIYTFITHRILDSIYSNRVILFIFCYFFIVTLILIFYYMYVPFSPFYGFLLLIDPIMIMICFLGSINVSSKTIGEYFFDKFNDIVVILAVISLLFWIIIQVIGLSPNTSISVKWGGQPRPVPGYYFIQFLPQDGNIVFLGKSLMRNSGIFVESPLYSYVLSISLLIELFIKKHTSKCKTIILLVTIFSTTSTTGLIVAVLAIAYYLIIYMKSLYKYFIIVLLPIVFVMIKFIFLNKVNSPGSSYGERSLEWHIDVIDWERHLFIGNGLPTIGNNGTTHTFGTVGLSSGLMAALAYGGIILAMFYILPSLCSLFVSKEEIGLSVLSFLLFVLTIVLNSCLYIIIISYLWVSFILRFNNSNNISKNENLYYK